MGDQPPPSRAVRARGTARTARARARSGRGERGRVGVRPGPPLSSLPFPFSLTDARPCAAISMRTCPANINGAGRGARPAPRAAGACRHIYRGWAPVTTPTPAWSSAMRAGTTGRIPIMHIGRSKRPGAAPACLATRGEGRREGEPENGKLRATYTHTHVLLRVSGRGDQAHCHPPARPPRPLRRACPDCAPRALAVYGRRWRRGGGNMDPAQGRMGAGRPPPLASSPARIPGRHACSQFLLGPARECPGVRRARRGGGRRRFGHAVSLTKGETGKLGERECARARVGESEEGEGGERAPGDPHSSFFFRHAPRRPPPLHPPPPPTLAVFGS